MAKAEKARKLIADMEARGARFYLLMDGEFGITGTRLSRRERRLLERNARAIAEIVLQRARVLARAAQSFASQTVN